MGIHCYSQRLLNPFRGVINIIEYESAEAVSVDGVHWDIYVRDTELVSDIEKEVTIQTSDIRYGHWSEATGLKRGPLYPSADFKRLEEMGAFVYEFLLQHHRQVPFPLEDHHELWLLDQDNQPLVLIDSEKYLRNLDLDRAAEWRIGLACRDSFASMQTGNENSAEYLNRYIHSYRADEPSAQIFHRQPDGSGIGLHGIHVNPSLLQRDMPASCFPHLLIRQERYDDRHRNLLRDFLDWQAPWLLLLPSLSREERRHYELQSRKQALVVDKHCRLYPDVVDESQIQASRVEAQLRNSQPQALTEEDVQSTFYIELNPGPTD